MGLCASRRARKWEVERLHNPGFFMPAAAGQHRGHRRHHARPGRATQPGKEYLASKQLPLERLFLGNVRTGEAAEKGEAKPEGAVVAEATAAAGTTGSVGADAKPGASPGPAKWSPRAELNLAVN